MTSPLDTLLARVGKTRADFTPKSGLGKILHRGGVPNTPEVQRILELHAYRWQDDETLEDLRIGLEAWIGRPPREDCKRQCSHEAHTRGCKECERAFQACVCRGDGVMHLRPLQVAALQAIHDIGGLLGPIRVGGGKTLISHLAGVVLEAERTLLVIPAKLVPKTRRDFSLLSRHWRSPEHIHIMSYELLSRDRGLAELTAYRPNLVMADEAHKLKHPASVCTKRMNRHLTKDNPDCKYGDMSGTITRRSVLEYHHRMNWAIPDGLQALPRKYPETRAWAEVLDAKPRVAVKMMPGALLQFCSSEEIKAIGADPREVTSTKILRQAYCRRLMTAPGVIGTEDQFDGAMALQVQGLEFEPGPAVVEAFRGLRENWELPDGHTIDTPTALWRHARELAQGFYYRWDPPPPQDWMDARREWGACVREALKHYHDLDSPLFVARAVDEGRLKWAHSALKTWRAIRPAFEPVTVPEWLEDTCLQWTASWATKNTGLIWVNETAFARRLAEETGLPYYAAEGKYKGKMIEDERGACIASIKSNYEGRNLQHFSKNLVASWPPGGDVAEQMLGRTHRDLQMADEVTVDVPLVCYEQWDVLRVARREARYVEDTTAQTQKLNFADVLVPSEQDVFARHAAGDPLWCKDNAAFFEDEA